MDSISQLFTFVALGVVLGAATGYTVLLIHAVARDRRRRMTYSGQGGCKMSPPVKESIDQDMKMGVMTCDILTRAPKETKLP